MAKNKFNIGDTVYAKVSTMGSYEPSICSVNEKMDVKAIEKVGDEYVYTCSSDGYKLKESELMSKKEYKASI